MFPPPWFCPGFYSRGMLLCRVKKNKKYSKLHTIYYELITESILSQRVFLFLFFFISCIKKFAGSRFCDTQRYSSKFNVCLAFCIYVSILSDVIPGNVQTYRKCKLC